MSSSLQFRAAPQCSYCIRRYLAAGFNELATPPTALHQQVRGKKKLANNNNAVPVRLLKNVSTFGRKGALVPISHGQMRNDWFPRRIAEYVTLPELRTLRARNILPERDFDFSTAAAPVQPTNPANTPPGGMTTTDKVDASMFQKHVIDPQRLSPERSMQLVEIFVPARLDFYRQPIIEDVALPAPPETKTPARGYEMGIGGELMAARAQQTEVSKPKSPPGPQAIYGSVSTHDVLMAIRAAMAENDEAKMVVVREEDVSFVGLGVEEGGERVKHVGDFKVEIKVKGLEEGLNRNVKVIAQDVA
ncbi:hypothetical protein LTR53_016242 [Teratosphaeriaceae sp. CCFEE 6253]|nr:hypothetical protein LTR53_016242 [Teratosphaeriaceae sp. CCFEE 6253]